MKRLLITELKRLNIPVKSTSPSDDQVDTDIQLGGKYANVSIQYGSRYYIVNKWVEKKECMYHIDGTGNLEKDIKDVMKKA